MHQLYEPFLWEGAVGCVEVVEYSISDGTEFQVTNDIGYDWTIIVSFHLRLLYRNIRSTLQVTLITWEHARDAKSATGVFLLSDLPTLQETTREIFNQEKI